jgi:S1-C subfamily serine protease
MNRLQNSPFKLLLLLLILFSFTSLACQLGTALEATPTPRPRDRNRDNNDDEDAPEPTPTVTPAPESDESDNDNDSVTIEALEAATVQIFAKQMTNGRLQTIWTGSGTILSADGIILTNAHVAAPTAPGLATLYNDPELLFSEQPDQLVIALHQAADRPPIETYVAEVVAADGPLDLAVIKIVADLDGNALDSSSLNLPFVEIGDSDTIGLGDEIRVLGYPGAGGETITFTKGNVSGFESQDFVGDRAWIKTDTTVSPGNSGGLGVNARGQIIGVPSFVREATGGAINRLRSVNYALPLLEAVQSGRAYESPFVVSGTGQESFTYITWADDYGESDQCAIGERSSYPANTTFAVAVFEYDGMSDGEQVLVAWWLEDELLTTSVSTWTSGESGSCAAFFFHNYGDPIDDGNYTVEIYVGGELDFAGSAETAVGGAVAANSGNTGNTGSKGSGSVIVEGEILDADSGKPLNGAVIFVLQPGTDLDAWLENPMDTAVYTFAETNEKGQFSLPLSLERDVSYPGVAGLTGYRNTDGFLNFTADDPDTIFLTLELSQ